MTRLILVPAIIFTLLQGTGKTIFALSSSTDTIIYLLPGQGADYRLFKYIEFPYDTVHLAFPVPGKNTTLREYAH